MFVSAYVILKLCFQCTIGFFKFYEYSFQEDTLNEPDSLYEEDIVPSSAVIKKCKRIEMYFHQSSKATNTLKKECESRNLNYYRIVQSVVTRWNSLYFMLKRIQDCVLCINFVLITMETSIPTITSNDEAVISDLLCCLKPFANATEELSGEKFVSMSLVLHNTEILLEQLEEVKNSKVESHLEKH